MLNRYCSKQRSRAIGLRLGDSCADTPLTFQSVDPLCEEALVLLLQPRQQCSLDISIQPKSMTLQHFQHSRSWICCYGTHCSFCIAIKRKYPSILMMDVTMLYDFALPHMMRIVQDTLFSMHWKVFNSLPLSLELQLCDLHVLCPFLGSITRAGNLLEVKLPCPRWCAAFSSGPGISIQKGSIG